MKTKSLALVAIAGVTAALVVPGIASGNARRTIGSLSSLQQAETPYVTRLLGANETPAAGDPDGSGAAAVSFQATSDTTSEVCWDLSFAGIAAPTAAHIHRAAAGVAGPIVVDFGAPGPTSATGCASIDAALAAEIAATPGGFYVNVHNPDFPGGALRGQLSKGAEPSGAQHLLQIPVRAYDSRDTGQTKLAVGTTRTLSLMTGRDNSGNIMLAVPPGATGALVTLTITETEAPGGFVKMYGASTPEPATSSINWQTAGASIAVTAPVVVDAAGSIKVTAGVAGTHVVVDVVGYFY